MKKELQKLGYKFREYGDINNLEYTFGSGNVVESPNSMMNNVRHTFNQKWYLKIKNLNIVTLVEQLNGIYKIANDDGAYPQEKNINGNFYVEDYSINFELKEDGYLIELDFKIEQS